MDVPKYSKHRDLFRYAREVGEYVHNHRLGIRQFSDREVCHIVISHIYKDYYKIAILKYDTTAQSSAIIDTLYLVPTLVGTIDRMAPTPPRPSTMTTPRRPGQDTHIRSTLEYVNDKDTSIEDL